MGWLQRLPLVSVLIASAMIAMPLLSSGERERSVTRFESLRDAARDFLLRHPGLEVDARGETILDPAWRAEAQAGGLVSDSAKNIQISPRLLARSQQELDALIETAFDERMRADPTWRYGVLDAKTPPENYFLHAFVHEALTGIILCVAVLLFVGAPLERAWGSGVFTLFAALAIPATAQAYRFLDASSGVPWSGGAGLAGALIGAYFIRGLGGHFLIPGWVLLPVWLGIESFVVREFWLDDLGGVPWATLCASVGLGASFAGSLRLLGVESALDSLASKKTDRAPNPILSRAARLRSDGDPYQAFDLILAAWRDDPLDEEIAEACFSIAVDVGQPDAAAEAILPSLRNALRAGDMARALDYWLPIATVGANIRLEATSAIRLGEALLDAGHPDQALFSLRSAFDAGVSSAQAIRIVTIARDLDEPLARQAAALALADGSLAPALRADLEAVASSAMESQPGPAPRMQASRVDPGMAGSPRSPLDRRVQAEHHPVETTVYPLEADSDRVAQREEDPGGIDPNESRIIAQGLDFRSLGAALLSGPDHDSESSDVLSHWRHPSASARLDASRRAAPDLLEGDDPEAFDETFALAGDFERSDDFFAPVESETDSDRTPLMRYSIPSADTTDTTDTTHPTDVSISGPDEFAIGLDGALPPVLETRLLKAVDAIPIAEHHDAIEIEVEGRGKSKLPLERIEVILMAAITGLAARPVLVVDFALNWTGDLAEPLKVIRLRSDRFDPRRFEPSEQSSLEALTAWVRRLQRRSQANCLPSHAILDGHFARFDSIEAYERDMLRAMRNVSQLEAGR